MKPGHIITSKPDEYADDIATATAQGWCLTAGLDAPAEAKYVFSHAELGTPFAKLAKELQSADCRELTFAQCTVTNTVKGREADRQNPIRDLPIPQDQEMLPGVALVLCYYNDSPERREATRQGLEQLSRLDPLPEIVFGEMVRPGEEAHFQEQVETIPGAIYVQHVEHENNRDLMHKEGWYNVLADAYVASRGEPDVWIFGDVDAYPVRPCWARRYRDEVLSDPGAIVQGFCFLVDTVAGPDRPFYSLAYRRLHSEDPAIHGNPGLYWGMTPGAFRALAGINPWAMCGGGDALFVWEAFGGLDYRPEIYQLSVYTSIMQKSCGFRLGSVSSDETLVHINHGPYGVTQDGSPGRGYRYRWQIMQHYGANAVKDNVELDRRGFLAWKDPSCKMHRAVSRKGECASPADVDRVIADAERGIVTITRRQFCIARDQDAAYYKPSRWDRYQEITDSIRRLPVECFERGIFELGPYLTPMVTPCDTMDENAELNPTYCQNATDTPWDIPDNAYSLAIASHSLEHLGESQPAVIAEMARIADTLLIVLPLMWTDGGALDHCGINEDTLAMWVHESGAKIKRTYVATYPGTYGQFTAVYESEK